MWLWRISRCMRLFPDPPSRFERDKIILVAMRYLVVASLVVIGSVVVRNVTDAVRGLALGQAATTTFVPAGVSRTELARSAP